MQKMALENSLLKESLAQSHEKLQELKTSNEVLKESIEEELEILVDKSNKILKGLSINYKAHIERIGSPK